MEAIHGNDVLLSMNIDSEFVPVLCAVGMTFSVRQEVLLATTADTGIWRRKRLRGLSEWNVSLNGLTKIDNTDGQVSFFYLLQESIRGTEQEIQIMFNDADGNLQVLMGIVLIPDLTIDANVNDFAGVTVTFEGTGAVTIQEPVSDVESCEVVFSDSWEAEEGLNYITGNGLEGRSFEDKELVEVVRDGIQHDYTSGTPGNRQYTYDGSFIYFDETNPFNEGETIFVIWKQ